MLLREAKKDLLDGIYIRFRTDGSVFNLRHLLSRTKNLSLNGCLLMIVPSWRTQRNFVWAALLLRQSSNSLWIDHQSQGNRSHVPESPL